MWARRTFDQTQRCIALGTPSRIGEVFHPGGPCFRLVAGLDEVFQRFSQVFRNVLPRAVHGSSTLFKSTMLAFIRRR